MPVRDRTKTASNGSPAIPNGIRLQMRRFEKG